MATADSLKQEFLRINFKTFSRDQLLHLHHFNQYSSFKIVNLFSKLALILKVSIWYFTTSNSIFLYQKVLPMFLTLAALSSYDAVKHLSGKWLFSLALNSPNLYFSGNADVGSVFNFFMNGTMSFLRMGGKINDIRVECPGCPKEER